MNHIANHIVNHSEHTQKKRTLALAAAASAALAAMLVPAGSAFAATQAPAASGAATSASVAASYPTSKSLTVAGDDQDNYYFCGPASVRNALSARNIYSVQSDLAPEMDTDTNGTPSVANVTPVLNDHADTSWYESKYISGSTATQAQKDLLVQDVLLDTNNGYVIVANIVGTGTDTNGGSHTYSGGHYIDVIGYTDSGATSHIYDPADNTYYYMDTGNLATWIAERGYSA